MSGRKKKLKKDDALGSKNITSFFKSISKEETEESSAQIKSQEQETALSITNSDVSVESVKSSLAPSSESSAASSTDSPNCPGTSVSNTDQDVIKPSTSSTPYYLGLPLNVERLLKIFPSLLTRIKEKEKSHTRMLVRCNVCYDFKDEALKVSLNNSVPYSSSTGARTEGQLGAKRLIEHLKGKPHAAALETKKLHDQFQMQSDRHPWLNLFKKYRIQEVSHLIRLAMDCYNDTKCETVSGYSWPSRSLTSLFSDQLVQKFSQDWDCNMEPFELTGLDMHYRTTNVYYEMLSCISDVLRENLYEEVNQCDALGVQIDGSCDRQQLGIKFVTARLVKKGVISTRFLAAMEPIGKGANGLLEALGRSLEKPGNVSIQLDDLKQSSDTTEKDDVIANAKMPDFKAPVFDKLFSLSTDGEAANTGVHAGLWRKLNDELNRLVPCVWCVCHRSDLAYHDLITAVPELKRWYSQVKDTVKYFHVSSARTRHVKIECKKLGVTFKQFVNPPDVRFAQHVQAMCSSLLSNLSACVATWQDLASIDNEDRVNRQQAAGYLKMWEAGGQQYRITALMADILHHLACLQKEFQRTDLLLFDIPSIQERYTERLMAMSEKPYSGGWEEKLGAGPTLHYDNDEPMKCAATSTKTRRLANQFVTMSNRSYNAIRQETVETVKNFLGKRMNQGITESLKEISDTFNSTSPNELATRANILLHKMKKIDDPMKLTDDCIDLFIQNPQLRDQQVDLKTRFKQIAENAKGSPESSLTPLINLVLTTVPHSMVVERVVSHYNIFRSDKRLAMSLQSANNRLLIALNGPGTGHFDPRPAVAKFLQVKHRRYKEPQKSTYKNNPSVKKLFCSGSEISE